MPFQIAVVQRLHVRRRAVFGDMFVARRAPGDGRQIDVEFLLHDGPRPDPRRHGISPVHADAFAGEIGGRFQAGRQMMGDGAVVEVAHQENRQRRELHPVRLRADIGGQRHFADVVGHFPHHPAERMHQHRHFLEIQLEIGQRNIAFLQRAVIALGA